MILAPMIHGMKKISRIINVEFFCCEERMCCKRIISHPIGEWLMTSGMSMEPEKSNESGIKYSVCRIALKLNKRKMHEENHKKY